MITILTQTGAYPVFEGEAWGRDAEGDVHVYDGQETLVTVDDDAFVATLSDALAPREHHRLARTHRASLSESESESDADTGTATVACGGDTTHPDDHNDDAPATDHTATDNNDDTHDQ
jgi:hypothetical protein